MSVTFERQPCKAYRIRYLSEGRRPMLEADKNGSNEVMYPQIKIHDPHKRSGILRLTCVSSSQIENNGYCIHPNKVHLLDDKKASVDEFVVNYHFNTCDYDANDAIIMDLQHIWIEHVKVKNKTNEVDHAKCPLKYKRRKTEKKAEIMNFVEENIKKCIQLLDPFKLGYNQERQINYDEVRLCCVVEFADGTKSHPVVSDIIKNSEVEVENVLFNNGKVSGGSQMCIFVKNLKLKKGEEVIVRFFDAETGWTADEVLSGSYCNNQALCVTVPSYQLPVMKSKNVTFHLYKRVNNITERIDPSDHTFTYTPDIPQLDNDEGDAGIAKTQIDQDCRDKLSERQEQLNQFPLRSDVVPPQSSYITDNLPNGYVFSIMNNQYYITNLTRPDEVENDGIVQKTLEILEDLSKQINLQSDQQQINTDNDMSEVSTNDHTISGSVNIPAAQTPDTVQSYDNSQMLSSNNTATNAITDTIDVQTSSQMLSSNNTATNAITDTIDVQTNNNNSKINVLPDSDYNMDTSNNGEINSGSTNLATSQSSSNNNHQSSINNGTPASTNTADNEQTNEKNTSNIQNTDNDTEELYEWDGVLGIDGPCINTQNNFGENNLV